MPLRPATQFKKDVDKRIDDVVNFDAGANPLFGVGIQNLARFVLLSRNPNGGNPPVPTCQTATRRPVVG